MFYAIYKMAASINDKRMLTCTTSLLKYQASRLLQNPLVFHGKLPLIPIFIEETWKIYA